MAKRAPLFGQGGTAGGLFKNSQDTSESSLEGSQRRSPSPPALARKANPFANTSAGNRGRWAVNMGTEGGGSPEGGGRLGRMGAQRGVPGADRASEAASRSRSPAGPVAPSEAGDIGPKRRSKDVLGWMFGRRDEAGPPAPPNAQHSVHELDRVESASGYVDDDEEPIPASTLQLEKLGSQISLHTLGANTPKTPNMRPFRTKADEAPSNSFLEEYAVRRMREQVEADLRVHTLTVDELNEANRSMIPEEKTEVVALKSEVRDLKSHIAQLESRLREIKDMQQLLRMSPNGSPAGSLRRSSDSSPAGTMRRSSSTLTNGDMHPIAEHVSPDALNAMSFRTSFNTKMRSGVTSRAGDSPLSAPSGASDIQQDKVSRTHGAGVSSGTMSSHRGSFSDEPSPSQLEALRDGSQWRALTKLDRNTTFSTDESDRGISFPPTPNGMLGGQSSFDSNRPSSAPRSGLDRAYLESQISVSSDGHRSPCGSWRASAMSPRAGSAHGDFADHRQSSKEAMVVNDIVELGRMMAASPAPAELPRKPSVRKAISSSSMRQRHTLGGRSASNNLLLAARVGSVKQTWKRRGNDAKTRTARGTSWRGFSAAASRRASRAGSVGAIPEAAESRDSSESGNVDLGSLQASSVHKLDAVGVSTSSGDLRPSLRGTSGPVRGSLWGEAIFSVDEAAERVRDLSTQVTDTVQVGDRSGLFSTYACLGATQDVAGLCGLLQSQWGQAALAETSASFSFALEATVLESFSPEVEYGGFLDEMVRFCVPLQTVAFTVGPRLPRTSPSSASCRHDKVHNLFFTNANGSSTHGLCHRTYTVLEGKVNNSGDEDVDDVAAGDGTGILRTMYRAALTIKAFVLHKKGRYLAALRHRALRRVAWLQVSVETCHCILGEKPLHGFYSAVLEIIAMGDHNHTMAFEIKDESDDESDLGKLSPRALVARRRSFFDSPEINRRREVVADERCKLIERLHTFDIDQEASRRPATEKEHFASVAVQERAERILLLRDLDTGDARKEDGEERRMVAVLDARYISDKVAIALQIPCITPAEWSCIPLLSLLPPAIVTKSLRLLLLERSLTVVCPCEVKVSCMVMALHSLMSPFKWCGTVIPLLPLELIEVLHSPSPLLAGVCFSRERIEREQHDNLNLLVVGETADDARFVSERASCDWSDAGLLSDDALEQAVSDAQATLAEGPRRGSMYHLVRLQPQSSDSPLANTQLSPTGVPVDHSFSNNLTRLMRGLTSRERRATRQLRNGVVEHHRRLCGDLTKNIRNWKKYGLFNREDDEFFFQADLVHNEMKKEFAFRTTVTNTQAFAEFVEFCRVRADDEDQEVDARQDAVVLEDPPHVIVHQTSLESVSSNPDPKFPVGISI